MLEERLGLLLKARAHSASSASDGLHPESTACCISHQVTGQLHDITTPCPQGAEPLSRVPPRPIMSHQAAPCSWTEQAPHTAPLTAVSGRPGAATPARKGPVWIVPSP